MTTDPHDQERRADGVDYETAKVALQPLIDDEQLLSYKRLED